jgi:hypothetical protein
MADNQHDAAGAALGYLYQTQWPLIELIRRGRHQPDAELRLELLDDVVWMEDGQPRELVQLKHHVGQAGGLGDMSVDLWRTLSVWMDATDPGDVDGPSLMLVTTSVAPNGSAASTLRPSGRDPSMAHQRLVAAAQESDNATTEDWRGSFLELSTEQQETLVSRIWVGDGAPPIEDLDAHLREELHLAVPIGQEAVFIGLVWDWWFRQAVSLLRRQVPVVSALQLAAAVDDLRDRFTTDNLPTLVEREAFDDDTLGDYDQRTFVKQLNFVSPPEMILRRSIQDYYRATVQSARWIENNLVDLPEVARFKDNLCDEWERNFAWAVASLSEDATETDKRRLGQEILQRCLDTTEIQIRPRYHEPFYFRGKMHELADERLVGWHPDFQAMLDELLAVAE